MPSSRSGGWRDRAEYALVRVLEAAVAHLPGPAAERLGMGAGALAGGLLAVRREVVEANLRRAFPAAPPQWVAATAAAAYRHLGREGVAMLRLSRLGRDEVVRRTQLEGWEAFRAGVAEGRGALLVTGHFGNWEVGAAAIAARDLPMHAVVKRQRNRLFDARLDALRRGLGVDTIDMGDAPKKVSRVLRAGHVVGIVGDQDARRTGIWVPFFGHPASTHRGPALFALRLGAPVFASAVFRLPGERYRVALERVPVERTDDLEADVQRLTTRLAERLEAAVRQAPEQYFWFHKRWKTQMVAEPGIPMEGKRAANGGADTPVVP